MNSMSRRIAKWHGTFLVIFTVPFFFYINSVPFTGAGLYGFMKDDFWAVGGFSQAYMVMCFFGLSLVLGSRQSDSRSWNWLGALVHLVFIILYALNFGALYEGIQGMAYGGLVLHSVWALLEILAAMSWLPFGRKSETVAA